MISFEIVSTIGRDGVLRLELPVSSNDAGRQVRVSVAPLIQPDNADDWRAGILETAGAWAGDFERPEQGEYEIRESLS